MLHIHAVHQPAAGVYVVEPAYLGSTCANLLKEGGEGCWGGEGVDNANKACLRIETKSSRNQEAQ